jgi:hypothetical protein
MRSELSTVQHVGFVIPATGVSFDRLLSGVADAQLSLDAREYVAVWGCARALVAAVVAVTVPSAVARSGGAETAVGSA